MEFVAELWLPIVLSAVFVFVVSSILHMVVPLHKKDYKKLPGEAEILTSMRAQGVRPGAYMFPAPASMKDMCSPEMLAKFKEGPVGHLTVLPSGAPSINKSLVQWFLFCVLVGIFVAYAARHALSPGAEYLTVFRLAGTLAIMGYAFGPVCDSIWKGQSWSIAAKFIFDGLLYGLTTAGTFAWLWPDVA